MTLVEFRDSLIECLQTEKAACEADIATHRALPDDAKTEAGFLIRGVKVLTKQEHDYELAVAENNSKLRPGDRVKIRPAGSKRGYDATIIENGCAKISLTCPGCLLPEQDYVIEVVESLLFDHLIELLGRIEEGASGSVFLRCLAGIDAPEEVGLAPVPFSAVAGCFSQSLNPSQLDACKRMLQRPSFFCLQGPPGTGKTDVLAAVAHAFSVANKDVLVIACTHQAVNNALNKIATKTPGATIVKVGEALKAQELTGQITLARTYHDYSDARKRVKHKKSGDVVGMTLHAGVFNLGLRASGFKPSIVLIDEAGQMPLTQAACIGAFGSGCLVFIGDDKQMPPIFHPSLADSSLAVSAFSYLCSLYPAYKSRLTVTYRMNAAITAVVSRCFYEGDGEPLVASDFSRDRRLSLGSRSPDNAIASLLNDPGAILVHNPTTARTCEDANVEEAAFCGRLLKEAIACGMGRDALAVVTPFRRQVKALREEIALALDGAELPLIDTVERLQGQDVDLVIISFAVSSPAYFSASRAFLFNPNRLNVMISRAKKKVIVLASSCVQAAPAFRETFPAPT